MKKIVVIGGGGHAKVLIGILKKSRKYRIAGYVDIKDRGMLSGVPYLGDDSRLKEIYQKGVRSACLGIGEVKAGTKRKEIRDRVKAAGFAFPVIVSPNTVVGEDAVLGEGTQVLDGVIVNPGSRIGECCILNTHSTVEHDCVIGAFCHIAPGAVLSGGVEVGAFSMIGAGAVVSQHVKIANRIMVGAGSVVIRDLEEPGTYVGAPARKIR